DHRIAQGDKGVKTAQLQRIDHVLQERRHSVCSSSTKSRAQSFGALRPTLATPSFRAAEPNVNCRPPVDTSRSRLLWTHLLEEGEPPRITDFDNDCTLDRVATSRVEGHVARDPFEVSNAGDGVADAFPIHLDIARDLATLLNAG